MRILFVVPYTPSLIRVRPYNLIRELSNHGQEVTVATVWSDEEEWAEINHLQSICERVVAVQLSSGRAAWNSARALPSDIPIQSIYSWHPGLLKEIDQLSSNGRPAFDVIHVEHLRGARYGIRLKERWNGNSRAVPVVWDSVDCISSLFEQAAHLSRGPLSRWITKFELDRTRRYEAWLLGQFDHVLVTSALDRQNLLGLTATGAKSAPVSVIKNGVDLEYFTPEPSYKRKSQSLVMTGKMSYHANVAMVLDFVGRIFPRVEASRPEVELWIVGKDPPREIRSLGEKSNIHVTGAVSDIRPYLRQAALAVTPIAYGVGIQNKVLEAMACATPIVATPQAISALDVDPGQDIVVASEPSAFASAVERLLLDAKERERLGRAGLRYVSANHQWSRITSQLVEIYHAVTDPQR